MSLDPKPYIIKTGSLCKSPSVNKSPKTVSLTNSLTQFPRVLLKPRRIKAVRDRLDPKPFVTKTGSLCLQIQRSAPCRANSSLSAWGKR